MFSIVRNLGTLQKGSKAGYCFVALSRAMFIKTCNGSQNSDNIAVPDNIVSLELIQKQKIKKTARTLSTINQSVPLAARSSFSRGESRELMAVFPDLVGDLTEYARKYDSKVAVKRFIKALQYNVPRGTKFMGLISVLAYKQLVDSSQLTPENIRLAQYLGWCAQMLHGVYVIIDDIMDDSTTRRGQTCYHKLEDVGMAAINDSVTIANAIYYILKKYFSHTDYYTKLVELFHEGTLITTLGQSLDLQMDKKDITSFTMEQYKAITYNKTSFSTFYLPVALAMHMAGFKDQEVFRQAKTILIEIGHFYQVQDDFIDCFGDPAITGKIGTDIQNNKCSWLAVMFMQRASDEQKEIMRECYGKNDPTKVDRVKQLYKELSLPNAYVIYEDEFFNMIKTNVQQICRGVPHDVFFNLMDKIYQRKY